LRSVTVNGVEEASQQVAARQHARTGPTAGKRGNPTGSNQYERKPDKKEKYKNSSRVSNRGGTSAAYRVARLKRDHPDVIART
jgi:hypothetical protein